MHIPFKHSSYIRSITNQLSGGNVYIIDFTESISPGSYWCRNKNNHSIIAESKVILTGN